MLFSNRNVGLLMFGASFILVAAYASAQEPSPRAPPRIVEPPPTAVDKRLATLEQKVAALEAQNTELRKMIVISGDTLSIRAKDGVSVDLSKTFSVRASNEITMKAGTTANYESSGATKIKGASASVESSSTMLVKGALVQLNAGTRPIAGSTTVFTD